MNIFLQNHNPYSLLKIFDQIRSISTIPYLHTNILTLRFALCIRKVDFEINCPDPCRLKEARCKEMGNSTGTCQNVMANTFSDYVVGQVPLGKEKNLENIKAEFLSWQARLPRNKRLAVEIFSPDVAYTVDLLLRLIDIQYLAAMDAQCNCKMYFKYEFFLDSCVEDFDSIFCKTVDVCKNGGECERAKDKNGVPINSVNCKCPPAYKGDFCEIERNPCAELPPTATCGDFTCLRDTNNLRQGFR